MKNLFAFFRKIFAFLFLEKKKEAQTPPIQPEQKKSTTYHLDPLPPPQPKKKKSGERKYRIEPDYFPMPNISLLLKKKNIQ